MARKGPVGGAFGKSIRKKPDTGTHNLQREIVLRELLKKKSEEINEMHDVFGRKLGSELMQRGLTSEEARLANRRLMDMMFNESGSREVLSKNPALLAKLLKQSAKATSLRRKYDTMHSKKAKEIFEKWQSAETEIKKILQEIETKAKAAGQF